jgi:hypothetical protein
MSLLKGFVFDLSPPAGDLADGLSITGGATIGGSGGGGGGGGETTSAVGGKTGVDDMGEGVADTVFSLLRASLLASLFFL